MPNPPAARFGRQLLVGVALVAGVTAGAYGIATAANRQAEPPPTTAAPAPSTAPACQGDKEDDKGSNEQDDQQDKSEQDALVAQAKVNEQQAKDAAAKAAGGNATEAKIEKKKDVLVWEVDVTKPDNTKVEVKIDATTGAVVDQKAEGDD